ncbi:MAG: lamin tail domain-containing protein, partial [Anaerolineales bacterium]
MSSIPTHSRVTPPVWLRRFCAALALTLLLAWGLFAALTLPVRAAPVMQATAAPVVISEFRTSGGGTSPGNDEFIEIYNSSPGDVPVGGWAIQKSSSSGAISFVATIPTNVNLSPGQHYLIVNTAAPPAIAGSADLLYSASIADNGGIGLFLPDKTQIVDAVGMSAGMPLLEGAPLSPLANKPTLSYERKLGGASGNCVDTNDNASDFVTAIANPQNQLSSIVVPPCSTAT